MSNKEKLRKL